MKLNKFILPFFAFALMGVIMICTISSCADNPIVSKIKALSKDEAFSCEDLLEVQEFILENKEDRSFKGYVKNNTVDSLSLNKLLRKEIGLIEFQKLSCDFDVTKKTKANRVYLYLENSGSMDGYVNGITDYEAALADLVVESQFYYGKDNLFVNFINSEIIPAQITDIDSFFRSLNPGDTPYNVGNKSISELNELFKNVLSKTEKEDISIFISDCIYSLDKSRSTLQGLVFQQSLTKAVFLEKSREFPLSAFVMQMTSSFTGKYFDKDNKVTLLNNEQRPYYIWILGEENIVKDFLSKHNPSKYRGYKNSYCFTNDLDSKIKFELLKSTGLEGRVSFNRRNNTVIDEILPKNGVFQFAFAVDFSGYPDQKSVLDKSSYKITPGFELIKIEPIPPNNQPTVIHHNDWNKIAKSNFTHVVTVRTTDPNFSSEFSLSFINSLPKWIESSSLDDDADIKNNLEKTFGLKFLIQGIHSAYEYKGINSPKIEFTLNK